MNITAGETRAWCLYLAGVHRAASAGARRVLLPVAYECSRRPDALIGCGTCYRCTRALIERALYCSSLPVAELESAAHERAEAVFQYVTGLDERLSAEDGRNEDYTAMDSARFIRVMHWAGELMQVPEQEQLTSSGLQDAIAMSEDAAQPARRSSDYPTAWRPFLTPVDHEGRPRCQKAVMYVDATDFGQCALPAGHEEDCDTLPNLAPAPVLQNGVQ